MKRLVLFFTLLLSAWAAYAQPGSLSQSVIRYRVNDSTAAIAANVSAIAAGYAPMFYNNQATTPHWDIWVGGTGGSYAHVFDFSGGSGAGLVDADYGDITVSSSGTVMNIDAGVVTGTEIASDVALAGNPTTTTQSANNNSTRIATTAYADAKVVDGTITNGTTTTAPSQDDVFDALALKHDLANSSSSLTNASTVTITGIKHTLSSNQATITWTLSQTSDFQTTDITLNVTSTTWTFPANTLCVVEGVASGDNTASLTGVSGDHHIMSIYKDGTNYRVVIKNFGQ